MASGPDPLIAAAFDRDGPALLLYARQWVDSGVAEDAVQAVFLRLIASGRMPNDLRPWLFRCVRNEAISAARTARRRTARETCNADRSPKWFVPGTDDAIDAAAAEAALKSLPPTQREVVTLRVWSGMTLNEISAVTGLATSTVHDQYRSALAELRQRLEQSWKSLTRK